LEQIPTKFTYGMNKVLWMPIIRTWTFESC
jgi:hypothetical protein